MNKLLVIALLTFAVPAFAAEKGTPPGHPAMPAETAPQQKAVSLAGKVVETKDSGPYTYVLIEGQGKKQWAAIPKMSVKIGQQMTLKEGFEMKNFTSKSLGKTFETIIFSGGPAGAPSAEKKLAEAHGGKLPAGHPAIPGSPATAPAPKKGKPVKVKKAEGPNAYTIKQLFDKRVALDTKTVTVRGKVTKINNGILKRNWVHLEDGSGKPGKEDSYLVTTYPAEGKAGIAVGDTVTASGILHKNRDYGSGYRFYMILENTTFKKE